MTELLNERKRDKKNRNDTSLGVLLILYWFSHDSLWETEVYKKLSLDFKILLM